MKSRSGACKHALEVSTVQTGFWCAGFVRAMRRMCGERVTKGSCKMRPEMSTKCLFLHVFMQELGQQAMF